MKNKEQWEKEFLELLPYRTPGGKVEKELIDYLRSTIQAEREKTVQEIKDSMGFVVCVDPEAHEPENSELRKLKLAKIIQAEKEALLDELISDYEAPLKNDPNPNPTATLIWEKIVEEFKTRKSELGEKK